MQPPHLDVSSSLFQHRLLGRALSGRYEILEVIGTGGMASVFRARDHVLERTVAVKVLHPAFAADPEFVARFCREAEFSSSLSAHPNIISIFDIGHDGDFRYIVMEYTEARNLKDLIIEEGPLPPVRALSIGEQIASALDFAHYKGVVHRDIKPHNILVFPDDRIKVTDFGIAWNAASTPVTRIGAVMGTTHYLSPEQALGKQVEVTSDIYSLGIVLFEMLTGRLPFDGDDPFTVAMKHAHDRPPSPRDINPSLSPDAASLVLRALDKEPSARYSSGSEFATAMRSVDTSEIEQTDHAVSGAAAKQPSATSAPTVVMHLPPAVGAQKATPEKRSQPPGGWRHRSPWLISLAACLLLALVSAAALLQWSPAARSHSGTGRPLQHRVQHGGPPKHPNRIPVSVAHPRSLCTSQFGGGLSLVRLWADSVQAFPGVPITLEYTVNNQSGTCRRILLISTLLSSTYGGPTFVAAGDQRPIEAPAGMHIYKRQVTFPGAAAGQTFDLQGAVQDPSKTHTYGILTFRNLISVPAR